MAPNLSPLSQRYESCSWGVSPGNALVVSSAMDVKERRAIQNFLGAAVDQYGGVVDANVVDTNRQQQETFDDYGSGRQQQQQGRVHSERDTFLHNFTGWVNRLHSKCDKML